MSKCINNECGHNNETLLLSLDYVSSYICDNCQRSYINLNDKEGVVDQISRLTKLLEHFNFNHKGEPQ